MASRRFYQKAITEPISFIPTLHWGNVVELCEFNGGFTLGLVTFVEDSKSLSNRQIEVFKSNGTFKRMEPNFIRFASQLLTTQPEGGLDKFNGIRILKDFEEQSKKILKQNFSAMESVVAKQTAENHQTPLCGSKLFYEADIAVALFGDNPKPEELYAVHMYLHSYTEKFGRDAFYQSQNLPQGAGPYFQRAKDDIQLTQWVEELIRSLDRTIMAFHAAATNLLHSKSSGKSTDLERPEFEDFLKVIDRAATCGWQDSALNPYIRLASTLLYKVAPAKTAAQIAAFYERVGLGHRLQAIDISTHQSGLEFKSAVPSYKELEVYSGKSPGIEVEDPSVFSNRTQFDELAIAVDSESTIEVDDAISIQKTGDDVWLHVHVADPARLIPFNSTIDKQAQSMASTLYLPQCNYLMLPLNVGMKASLDPKRKYNGTMTFSAKLGSDGDILDYRVTQGVITNLKRLTFEQTNEHLKNKTPGIENTTLHSISSLVDKHRMYRGKRGTVDFHVPSSKIFFEHKKEPVPRLQFSIENHWGDKSSSMVSESMIIAGRVASLFAQDRNIAVPFRYHLDPAIEGGVEFLNLLDIVREKGNSASLFDRLKLLSYYKASAIDIQPREHWGLGVDSYCKATSPLRRYFDLLLHHQISQSFTLGARPKSASDLSKIIPSIYRHEQYLKRLERSSKRYWTIRYISELLKQQDRDFGEWRPLTVTVTPIDYSSATNSMHVFIEDFALRQFCQIPGGSELEIGIPRTLHLVAADPVRQTVQLVIP